MDGATGRSSRVISAISCRCPVELHDERHRSRSCPPAAAAPQFVLPTGGGLGYGDFTLDDSTRSYLLQNLPEFERPADPRRRMGDPLGGNARPPDTGVRVRFHRDGRFSEGRYRTEYSAAGRVSRRCLLDLPDRRSAEGCRAEARAGAANRYRSDEIVHHEGDLFLRISARL